MTDQNFYQRKVDIPFDNKYLYA